MEKKAFRFDVVTVVMQPVQPGLRWHNVQRNWAIPRCCSRMSWGRHWR
jgi:hypothetical protein